MISIHIGGQHYHPSGVDLLSLGDPSDIILSFKGGQHNHPSGTRLLPLVDPSDQEKPIPPP